MKAGNLREDGPSTTLSKLAALLNHNYCFTVSSQLYSSFDVSERHQSNQNSMYFSIWADATRTISK